MDINGYNQVNLTSHPASDTDPIFSPDGAKIVFISNRDNPEDVFIMDLEWRGGYIRYSGINQLNLSADQAYDGNPQFSPDGLKIVFESHRDNNYEIYLVNSVGGGLTNLTNNPGNDRYPQFSPDGSEITFVSDRDGNDEIYVMQSDGSSPINLTQHPRPDIRPRFSPIGNLIVFESPGMITMKSIPWLLMEVIKPT